MVLEVLVLVLVLVLIWMKELGVVGFELPWVLFELHIKKKGVHTNNARSMQVFYCFSPSRRKD